MKKILLFLTLSFIYLIGTVPVYATTNSFYEAEYIDNIYMVRYDKSANYKYYQKARVYRRTSDGKLAYCLQPFIKFNTTNNTYETVSTLPNISSETLNKINDIIGFGYGYLNHTDLKWYAITQLMIWQTVEPNSEFYFTDTLNGNKIEPYNSEINEINNLINDSYKTPSFNNQTYYSIVNKAINLVDSNKAFIKYSLTTSGGASVEQINNTITANSKNEGCFTSIYKSRGRSSDPVLFYYNPKSQHLATVGTPQTREGKVTFCFNELKLNLKKIDKDTGTNISSKEAKLKDSIFTLYNDKMEKIKDLKLDDNLEINLSSSTDNLDYGTYYLKETKVGAGYLTNNNTYKIEFTPNNTKINLVIENEVLKKEVTIKKYFGDGKLMEGEPNISFEIYNIDNELVDTITTDVNGKANIILPYGHYKIVQINTTEGYTKIDPFEIFINDLDKEYSYIINDYIEKEEKEKPKETISIEVPNTSTKKDNYPLISITLLPAYFFVKKKFN